VSKLQISDPNAPAKDSASDFNRFRSPGKQRALLQFLNSELPAEACSTTGCNSEMGLAATPAFGFDTCRDVGHHVPPQEEKNSLRKPRFPPGWNVIVSPSARCCGWMSCSLSDCSRLGAIAIRETIRSNSNGAESCARPYRLPSADARRAMIVQGDRRERPMPPAPAGRPDRNRALLRPSCQLAQGPANDHRVAGLHVAFLVVRTSSDAQPCRRAQSRRPILDFINSPKAFAATRSLPMPARAARLVQQPVKVRPQCRRSEPECSMETHLTLLVA